MSWWKSRLTSLLTMCLVGVGLSSAVQAGQQAKVFETSLGGEKVKLHYLLHLPPGYDPAAGKKWPLVIFLHGAGERGDNLDLVKVHGPPKMAEKDASLPYIIVSPQCPTGKRWDNIPLMTAWLNQLETELKVESSRIYLTGLSMGGYGTWKWAAAAPNRFSAIVPICGGGDPATAERIKSLPTWVFHGDKDQAVPISQSQKMVDAIKAAGGEPKFTIYEGVGHDSWTATYANGDVWKWMLEQRRK